MTDINSTNNECTLPANYMQYIPSFGNTQWFYAYHRRRQANRNFMTGQFKRQISRLPVAKNAEARLFAVNLWYTLLFDKTEQKLWSIQHDVFSKKDGYSDEDSTWKELAIRLPPSLFDCKSKIFYGHVMRRFVVAAVVLATYNDVKPIIPGNPIASMNEFEAQYFKKKENFNTLNNNFNIASTIVHANEREKSQRKAILVWSNASSSSPNIIYLEHGYQGEEREEKYIIFDIHNEWILLYTAYPQYSYQKIDLFDLDKNQWIEGLKLDKCSTSACIQFASYGQCQFLTCMITDDIGELDTASTVIAAQNSHTTGNDNRSSYIQWRLFDTRKNQSKSSSILSGQITIPRWASGTIQVKTYTERMCLITVAKSYIESNHDDDDNDRPISALLLFFLMGKVVSNASPQSLFDARDYGQLLPIDSSEKGRVLWIRPICDSIMTNLYSEKLIVLQNDRTIDVLDDRDGNLLRSIACLEHASLTPFIGSLCEFFSWGHGENWFIDMKTGRIYKPSACLTGYQTEDKNKNKFIGPIEIPHLPAAREDLMWEFSEHKVSNGVIVRVGMGKNRLYEVFML